MLAHDAIGIAVSTTRRTKHRWIEIVRRTRVLEPTGSQPDAAIGVVAEALRARVKLDAFTITSFISGFARKGQLSDALAAYQLGRWLDVPPSTVVRTRCSSER